MSKIYTASLFLFLAVATPCMTPQSAVRKQLITSGASTPSPAERSTGKSTEVLHFEGAIALPSRTRTFSVMDYLTVYENTLYVAGMSTGTLGVVRLDDLHLSKSEANTHASEISDLKGAHGLAIVPELNIGFATAGDDNVVAVIDLQKKVILDRLQVAAGPDAILYDAGTGLIYVGNAGAKLGTLIDPKARKIVATIPLGGETEFAVVDPQTGLLYQNLEDTSELAVIDLHKRAVVERWPLGSCTKPTGLAIDARARRLFVGCSGNATLSVLNIDSHKPIAAIPIGKRPDSVAYDEALHRIYTTGMTGKVVVIDQQTADKYVVLSEISTHLGAHTLTIDPATHRVYLACVGVFVRPTIAVYSVNSRLGQP